MEIARYVRCEWDSFESVTVAVRREAGIEVLAAIECPH